MNQKNEKQQRYNQDPCKHLRWWKALEQKFAAKGR